MLDICAEDECHDTYGRVRMHQALELKQPDGVKVPSERTVYRVMEEIGIIQSMNSAGGRCHDNARCESMWARLKEELLYNCYDASKM